MGAAGTGTWDAKLGSAGLDFAAHDNTTGALGTL